MAAIDQPNRHPQIARGAAVSTHSVELDALRGLAALLVVAFHARVLFFVDRGADGGWGSSLFYLVTAFGREAVWAFFVLSGYLIASSVQRDDAAGRWSAGDYSAARLSRLYVVLVPAMAIGLAWDALGLQLFPSAAVYAGALANGQFPVPVAANLGTANILAALVFVQAIFVPPPGSGLHYWSLAYEFWCYALFPLVYLALTRGALWQRTLMLALAGAIAAWLGRDVIAYLGIWLLGAAVALWPVRVSPRWGVVLMAGGTLIAAVFAYLILRHGLRMPASGFAVSAGVALMIAGSKALDRPLSDRRPVRLYRRFAAWLADRSYSLYAIHVPVLVFVRAWCGDELWQPTPLNVLTWLGLVACCLVYAHLFWLVSERHTAKVRRWLARLLASRKSGSAQLRASS